jgi:tetratricopeptide (TPR) repeat protein
MQKKKLATTLFLGLGALVFLAASLTPLLSGLWSKPAPSASPTPSVTTAASPTSPTPSPVDPLQKMKQDLKDQERGYTAVLAREPDNPTVLEGLVRTRLQLIQLGEGDIKSVIAPLEKLTQQRPENTEYRIILGQAQAFTGQREAAAQTYRSVLATKPGEIKALQALVGLFIQQGRPEAAMGLLQDTLKMAPKANQVQPGSIDVFAVQLLLGDVYSSQGRFDEAQALFDSLIKQEPRDYRPLLGKGLALQQQGKTQQAKTLLLAAAELAPAQVKDQIKKMAGIAPSPAPGTSPSTPPGAPTPSLPPGTTPRPTGSPVAPPITPSPTPTSPIPRP